MSYNVQLDGHVNPALLSQCQINEANSQSSSNGKTSNAPVALSWPTFGPSSNISNHRFVATVRLCSRRTCHVPIELLAKHFDILGKRASQMQVIGRLFAMKTCSCNKLDEFFCMFDKNGHTNGKWRGEKRSSANLLKQRKQIRWQLDKKAKASVGWINTTRCSFHY